MKTRLTVKSRSFGHEGSWLNSKSVLTVSTLVTDLLVMVLYSSTVCVKLLTVSKVRDIQGTSVVVFYDVDAMDNSCSS